MKKFLAAFLLLFLFPLSACTSTTFETSEEGWIEVQSIKYNIGDENTTLTSTFEWVYEVEEDNVLLNNVPQDQKDPFPLSGEISIVKNDFIKSAQEYNGKSYYFTKIVSMPEQDFYGIKAKVLYCLLQYITIKFDNDAINIKHYVNGEPITERIVPSSYQITYFSE